MIAIPLDSIIAVNDDIRKKILQILNQNPSWKLAVITRSMSNTDVFEFVQLSDLSMIVSNELPRQKSEKCYFKGDFHPIKNAAIKMRSPYGGGNKSLYFVIP